MDIKIDTQPLHRVPELRLYMCFSLLINQAIESFKMLHFLRNILGVTSSHANSTCEKWVYFWQRIRLLVNNMNDNESSWELSVEFGALGALNYLSATVRDCFTKPFNDSVHQNVFYQLYKMFMLGLVKQKLYASLMLYSLRQLSKAVDLCFLIVLTFHSYSF